MAQQSARDWFDAHAESFRGAAAIESAFVGLPEAGQRRLDDFKLWAMDHDPTLGFAGATVLEFGAGHGRLALRHPEIGRYVGVDYSANLARIGNERLAAAGLGGRAAILPGDCLDYDGPASAFDVVCSLGMFPYVHDTAAVLRKMAWHAKPGGRLMIDFHHASPIYAIPRAVKHRLLSPTGGESTKQSRRQLRKLLGEAGFGDIRFVMREYPLLADLHCRKGWQWPLALRNWLAAQPPLDVLATDGFVFAVRHR